MAKRCASSLARRPAAEMLDAEGDNKLIPYVMSEKWEDPEVRDLPLFKNVIKFFDRREVNNL